MSSMFGVCLIIYLFYINLFLFVLFIYFYWVGVLIVDSGAEPL